MQKTKTGYNVNIIVQNIYYNFNLKNGKSINGDIYWNDKTSYIVFTIDGKKYVNIFMLTGAQQLKSIFKL